eukprot:gb/GEZN01004462.1/.p1 GENE.gb/GEZN01004462.1/~~gb/GEZN01004462.1/.p1  ORF type:complete len:620 (+),score=69.09 gb/GEZN01004462.1/:23-1882(+)
MDDDKGSWGPYLAAGLSMTRDVTALSAPLSSLAFNVADSVRSFWMGLAASGLDKVAVTIAPVAPAGGVALAAASAVIKVSDKIAQSALHAAGFITTNSLTTVDTLLLTAGFTEVSEVAPGLWAQASDNTTSLIQLGNMLAEFSRQHHHPDLSLRDILSGLSILTLLHSRPDVVTSSAAVFEAGSLPSHPNGGSSEKQALPADFTAEKKNREPLKQSQAKRQEIATQPHESQEEGILPSPSLAASSSPSFCLSEEGSITPSIPRTDRMLELDFRGPEHPDIEELQWGMRLAASAYGWKAQHVLRTLPSELHEGRPIMCEPSALAAQTGIPWEQVISAEKSSEIYRPGYILAVDKKARRLVLTIRGTMRISDVVTDLVCQSDNFTSLLNVHEETLVEGRVHRGFLKSAERLAAKLEDEVSRVLRDLPDDYELRVIGHSLGAGVGTLLTLLWARRVPLFRKRNLRCLAFAAPCTLCPKLASAPFTHHYVQAIVAGNDIVCRLSLGSVSELLRRVMAVALHAKRQENSPTEEHAEAARQLAFAQDIPASLSKLCAAGKIWHLYVTNDSETKSSTITRLRSLPNHDPELAQIIISPDMFKIHLPNVYLDLLSKLKLPTQIQPSL